MNLSEVAVLLGTVSAYDLRIEVSELKVRAWYESLDQDIPLREGQKLVSWFYSNFDSAVSPSAINREWRRRKRDEQDRLSSQTYFKQIEQVKEQKASPEAVKRYAEEIRSKIGKSNAPVESDRGEVAPDL